MPATPTSYARRSTAPPASDSRGVTWLRSVCGRNGTTCDSRCPFAAGGNELQALRIQRATQGRMRGEEAIETGTAQVQPEVHQVQAAPGGQRRPQLGGERRPGTDLPVAGDERLHEIRCGAVQVGQGQAHVLQVEPVLQVLEVDGPQA